MICNVRQSQADSVSPSKQALMRINALVSWRKLFQFVTFGTLNYLLADLEKKICCEIKMNLDMTNYSDQSMLIMPVNSKAHFRNMVTPDSVRLLPTLKVNGTPKT